MSISRINYNSNIITYMITNYLLKITYFLIGTLVLRIKDNILSVFIDIFLIFKNLHEEP